ncbi:MAG: transglycosylase SLT domain-containing protein [Pseudomonadota bacterium]
MIYLSLGSLLAVAVAEPVQSAASVASAAAGKTTGRTVSTARGVQRESAHLPGIIRLVDVLGGKPEHARSLLGAGREFGIDPVLLASLAFVESSFREKVRSKCGALGLMQIKPLVANVLGVTDPWDPHQNIMAGAAYLRHCFERYRDHPESTFLALAAYNIGPGPVRKLKRSDSAKRFVGKVLRIYNHFTDVPIPAASRASRRQTDKRGYTRQADARR